LPQQTVPLHAPVVVEVEN